MKGEEKEQIEQGKIGWEELFVAKYFGIKDKHMEEMLKAYHQSKLQALKEEVEQDLKKAEHFNNGDGSADDHFWRGRKNQSERFLNLITNLEYK